KIARITAPYIASPPSSGIGWACTLRGTGRSIMPTRKASARTGTVSINDANSAMKKASMPAAMRPRRFSFDEHPPEGGHTADVAIYCPGWGPGSQVLMLLCSLKRCPTQHVHLIPDFAVLPSKIAVDGLNRTASSSPRSLLDNFHELTNFGGPVVIPSSSARRLSHGSPTSKNRQQRANRRNHLGGFVRISRNSKSSARTQRGRVGFAWRYG